MIFNLLRTARSVMVATSVVVMSATAAPALAAETEGEAASPFAFDAILTTDVLRNTRGGRQVGTRALTNLDLTADWQIGGGWEAHGDIEITEGGGFSGRLSEDYQTASNIDLPTGVRLYEAWLRKTSEDEGLITTLGFIDINGMFDVQDTGGLFLNASHGFGVDFAQSGASSRPIAALGAVQEWHPRPALRFRAAVFNAVAGDPDNGDAFAGFAYSDDTGLQYAVEAEADFDGGYVKLGHWANTIKSEALDISGQFARAHGTYAQVAARLMAEGDSPDQGLSGWLRVGVANAEVLPVDRYVGGGVVYTGPFPGRDHDQVGLAIASARFGSPYGFTMPGPIADETSFEISYQYEVKPGFIIQPDLQYIRHPSGNTLTRDAVVVGLRLQISLGALGGG